MMFDDVGRASPRGELEESERQNGGRRKAETRRQTDRRQKTEGAQRGERTTKEGGRVRRRKEARGKKRHEADGRPRAARSDGGRRTADDGRRKTDAKVRSQKPEDRRRTSSSAGSAQHAYAARQTHLSSDGSSVCPSHVSRMDPWPASHVSPSPARRHILLSSSSRQTRTDTLRSVISSSVSSQRGSNRRAPTPRARSRQTTTDHRHPRVRRRVALLARRERGRLPVAERQLLRL